MNFRDLPGKIKEKQSFLCVGLDSDIEKLPLHLPKNKEGMIQFNKEIIHNTKDFCVSFKLNIAFYESLGKDGWEVLEETLKFIPNDIFTIADAKRGDIGNTSNQYAKTFFETYSFDSITVAPYMGEDSIAAFLNYPQKASILLALTSNVGSQDFQYELIDGKPLYQLVIEKSQKWENSQNLMYVVGATHPEEFSIIRAIVPNTFLLVPGVGAQGGSLQEVCRYGLNDEVGLLINSSRGIIYASNGRDFGNRAAKEAEKIQLEMASILKNRGLV